MNHERAEEGLPPLAAHPVLEEVAALKAMTVAETRSLDRTPADINRTGRELRKRGYRFHHWKQRVVAGEEKPERLLSAWRKQARADYRSLVLGDYEHVGIAQRRTPGGFPIVAIMVGLPRSTIFYREAAALDDLGAVRATVVAAANTLRAESGRAPLRPDATLDAVAQRYAEELRDSDRYSHIGPEGSRPGERARAAGYPYRWLAENLAKGLFSPDEVVARWNASSDHRFNMLHQKAVEVGIGVAYGETGGELDVLWVMVVGAR